YIWWRPASIAHPGRHRRGARSALALPPPSPGVPADLRLRTAPRAQVQFAAFVGNAELLQDDTARSGGHAPGKVGIEPQLTSPIDDLLAPAGLAIDGKATAHIECRICSIIGHAGALDDAIE